MQKDWLPTENGTFSVTGVGSDTTGEGAQQVSTELSSREFNTHYKLTIDFF